MHCTFKLFKKKVNDIGTATGKFGVQYKEGIGGSAGVKAAGLTSRSTFGFEYNGWELEIGASAEAFAGGIERSAIYKDGQLEIKNSTSALFGGGFVIRLKAPVDLLELLS